MASNPTTEQRTLEYWFTTTALGTRPTTWYLALHTGDPGTGLTNECADANYARQAITMQVVAGGDGYIARNTADITFPAFAAAQTIYWVSVNTSLTAGSPIHSAQLPIAAVFGIAGIVRIPINELVFDGV
jgi:hypothetical protein